VKAQGWRASLVVALVTLGVGWLDGLGALTDWELWVYDRFLPWQPAATLERPLLLVTITPADLQGRERITDRELQALLETLLAARVAVVGVDVIRDVPVGGDRAAQKKLVQLVNRQANAPEGAVILTCFLPDATHKGVLPPPGLGDQAQVVGFADVLPDADRVVRRNLLAQSTGDASPSPSCQSRYSLGFLTALTYLAQQGYELTTTPQQALRIHRALIAPLPRDAGPYRDLDTAGYQVFLRYRPLSTLAETVTLTQVMQGRTGMPLRNRVVLVGYAQSAAKPVVTPLGPMPSVEFHTQGAGQILRVALGGEGWLWWWPRWGQGLWLWVWSGVGAVVGWRARHRWPPELAWAPVVLLLSAWGASGLGGWVPLVAPGVAYLVTGMVIWWWLPRPLAVLRSRLTRPLPRAKTLDPKGRYGVQTCLGQDEWGWLYEATDQHVGKTVVVRVLKLTPSPQRREELRRTFVAQLERYVSLDNLHLIQILDFGLTKEGFPFYVREYLPGVSLRQRLRQQAQFSPTQAVYLIRQICKGLEPAHRHGWVHQDLKPDTIFLIPTGARPPFAELVKLLDFGLSQWIYESTADTVRAANSSSLPYTAPELFMETTATPSADIYSLGVLLYRMVSGHYPFPLNEGASFSQWSEAHCHQAPLPLSPPHPVELQPILRRCLDKDPSRRYPHAQALDQALEDWQNQWV
jgi:CHASE2 domain-containing sensor protein